jgi:hypothetical protein
MEENVWRFLLRFELMSLCTCFMPQLTALQRDMHPLWTMKQTVPALRSCGLSSLPELLAGSATVLEGLQRCSSSARPLWRPSCAGTPVRHTPMGPELIHFALWLDGTVLNTAGNTINESRICGSHGGENEDGCPLSSGQWVLIALMMEAVRTSETLVNFYQTTRRYNPDDSHLRNHRRENLKSYLKCNYFPHVCLDQIKGYVNVYKPKH